MISKALIKEFQNVAGKENVMTDQADRLTYSFDAAVLEPEMPSLAVRPVNGEALSQAVRMCNENRLPLTVRGAGTNLSGGVVPLGGSRRQHPWPDGQTLRQMT